MNDRKTCCFTGHRSISSAHFLLLPKQLDILLDSLVSHGFRHFKTGGAVGFDTLAALKCLELKKKYPSLPIYLELCLPCRDQTNGWSDKEKHVYNFVVSQADKVSYMQESYSVGCMYARTRKLVDGSDLCIAYLSTDKGGTAYTCNYAKQKGVRVINLYDHLNETDK